MWQGTIGWTDSVGTWNLPQWYVVTNVLGNSTFEQTTNGFVGTIREKAGLPLTYSVTGYSVSEGSTYEIYITVEQIQ
jgi:hypothetical protein